MLVSIWSYIQLPIACREVKPVESQTNLMASLR